MTLKVFEMTEISNSSNQLSVMEIIHRGMSPVLTDQVLIHQLGVVLYHIQARVAKDRLQVQNIHIAPQGQDHKCAPQGKWGDWNTSLF